MKHFWWGEEPPDADQERQVRDSHLTREVEPDLHRWNRWFAPAASVGSLAFLVFLLVRVLDRAPELPEAERPYAIYAYFDIILITVALGAINWWLWRKYWRW